MRRTIVGCALVLVGVGVFAATGCAGAPAARSTRLSASDIIVATDEVREALASSEFLTSRGPDSPPLRLMLIPAENKSVERLSTVDRSILVTNVGLDNSVLDLFRSKNIAVSVADDTRATLRRLRIDDSSLPAMEPTHYMLAEVRSITRQAGQGLVSDVRTDLMLVEYRIVEVGTGRAVWARDFQVKRAARGNVAD